MFIEGLIAVLVYIFIDIIPFHKHSRVFLLSFTSGILVAALLLRFIARLYEFDNSHIYLAIAAIFFTIFFSIHREKAETESELKRKQFHERILIKYYKVLHHLTLGFLFSRIAKTSVESLVIISIPLLLARFSAKYHISREKDIGFSKKRLIEDLSIPFSYVIGSFFLIPDYIYLPSLAIVTAQLFYSIISMIKKVEIVHLRWSLLGLILYSAFIFWRFSL